MKEVEPGVAYYSIIPATIRYDDNLSPNEKLMYGEITALTNERGYCWASNKYFSDLYKVNEKTVSRWVNNLKNAGHIVCEINSTPNGSQRIIRLGCPQKSPDPLHLFAEGGVREKVEHNNIIPNSKVDKYTLAVEIMDYFNLIRTRSNVGENCKPTEKRLKKINSMLKAGYKTDDFRKVINYKFHEWCASDKMRQYLMPETLFGDKFQMYLESAKSNTIPETDWTERRSTTTNEPGGRESVW